MSDVQLENGYTRIANELLEVIYSTNFNATQLKIVLCIIRYTYGFSRISHNISISFLSKATGVSKRYISDELKKMIDNKVVTVIQEHSTTTSRILKLNKNYSQWIGYRTILQQVNNTSTGEQLITTTDEQYFIQERKKDNIKESIPLKKESKIFSNDEVLNAYNNIINVNINEDNADINQVNDNISTQRKEKERKEVYNITLTPEETNYISVLSRIKDYPLDEVKDIGYMRTLKERYPSLDMVQAINKFSDYILDKPFKENANHRSQINTSFNKYVEWGACLKKVNNQDSRLGVPPCESILGERETPWM